MGGSSSFALSLSNSTSLLLIPVTMTESLEGFLSSILTDVKSETKKGNRIVA